MKKIFISQPMRGKTAQEIEHARINAIAEVVNATQEQVKVIDSFFKQAPVDARPLWYLGESLKLLAEADIAVFIDDWESARGCSIEHTCAKEYGIEIMYI